MASSAKMGRMNSSYKGTAFLRPPLSSPITITSAAADRYPSAQPSQSSNLLHPFPIPIQASSSRPTSSALTTPLTDRSIPSKDYDWSPILLFTPPPSYPSRPGTSSRFDRKNSSAPYCNAFPGPHHFDRNTVWPESPTLSTRRVKKHSQPVSGLESLCIAATRTASSDAEGQAMASAAPSKSSSPHGSQPIRRRLSPQTPFQISDSHKMQPSLKPRALTLDGADRPTLPPMPVNASHGRLGPIRTSPSTFRHGADYRSNPYFVTPPTSRSVDHARSIASLSSQSSREASDVEGCSPYHAPWTPTSSVRSTSSGVYHDEVFASSYTLSRTSVAAPLRLDSSPSQSRLLAPTSVKKGDHGHSEMALGTHLPSSHLATPNNALGLYMEPTPFPNQLLQFDLGTATHRGSTPRSGADFFLCSNGCAGDAQHQQGRTGLHVLTRSPAAMSDLSSQTPSPSSNSDDSLPKLSLAHRTNLDANHHTDAGPPLPLPSLQLNDSAHHFPISTNRPTSAKKAEDGDFLYKMPILRTMSPLADMSSDSEDDDADEPLAKPSTFPNLASLLCRANATPTDTNRPGLPAEGSTGEIFLESRPTLPLTLPHARAPEILFCKLSSTTHQCFSVVDGKWACYRRNYLRVDVAFHFEDESGRRRDNLSNNILCSPSNCQPFVVVRFAIHMTAHVIDTDGRLLKGRQGLVPLIQFGPARERGPREAVKPVEVRAGGIVGKDASANEQTAARSGNIAAFRRVQIRSATMNNGQRGSAGQQFYALKLTLLAYGRSGSMTASNGVEVASAVSHPITVRGRSKVHYAAPGGSGGGREGVKRESSKPSTSRAASAAQSNNKRASATITPSRSTSKENQNAVNSAGTYGEHRRSTRLLLATSQFSSSVQDADDEADGNDRESTSRSGVMDIRSVISAHHHPT
ncbi:uncharacterized protein MEPE_03210 [Melanopsichium pennsylvanicum]|uniref:NDT80 domain-containing protein n=2 Tax=Melanopsichium pennsylvanicum TaxID=63383 RepID=A0AAJ4XM76_9BASI|nr:p53-like transcription factor [Melanopsichium pennsylvanicum 4]SNX84501.1 uncharacterized protein MEPE_03210 [Melanopsichium pennsylvanicum]